MHARMVHIVFLKRKSEVLQKFQIFIEKVETETGTRVVGLRTDGGGEYESKEFKTYLESKGIQYETMNVYTLQENGISEWMNHTLVESA